MPFKGGRLTPQEQGFIEPMARTGDAPYAAYKAGLAEPDVQGYKLMKRPGVRSEVLRRAQTIIVEELLPEALNTIRDLMKPTTPHGARLGAAKVVIDEAMGGKDADAAEKEPSEMSYDELQASISRLKREQESREEGAKDVTPEQPSIMD